MLERNGKIVKFACLLLAALLVYRLAHIVPRLNPLAQVVIPTLPTLPPEKNAATNGAPTNPVKLAAEAMSKTNSHHSKSTNNAGLDAATSVQAAKVKANSVVDEKEATNATNLVADSQDAATNSIKETNAAILAAISTNGVTDRLAHIIKKHGTNAVVDTNGVETASLSGTNNSASNGVAGMAIGPGGKSRSKGMKINGPAGAMMAGMGMNLRGAPLPELPADIKARVNKITDSEILAQVMHPMPQGLIGIAGDLAFLRTATGQTGMIKAGETLGDLKLIRIGTNRVLVEQDGDQKELMIFDGYGGKSLLSEKGKTSE